MALLARTGAFTPCPSKVPRCQSSRPLSGFPRHVPLQCRREPPGPRPEPELGKAFGPRGGHSPPALWAALVGLNPLSPDFHQHRLQLPGGWSGPSSKSGPGGRWGSGAQISRIPGLPLNGLGLGLKPLGSWRQNWGDVHGAWVVARLPGPVLCWPEKQPAQGTGVSQWLICMGLPPQRTNGTNGRMAGPGQRSLRPEFPGQGLSPAFLGQLYALPHQTQQGLHPSPPEH